MIKVLFKESKHDDKINDINITDFFTPDVNTVIAFISNKQTKVDYNEYSIAIMKELLQLDDNLKIKIVEIKVITN